MGIRNFAKVFPPKGEIKYTDLKDKRVIIDASTELNRCALGMKKIDALTDKDGNSTIHINALLLGVILKLKSYGINQYWVFDYDQKRKIGEPFHIQLKELEIIKRKSRKQKAREKLKELNKHKKDLEDKAREFDYPRSDSELFSSSEDEIQKDLSSCMDEINKQKKRSFVLKRFYTDDTILMLNLLDVPWFMCPPGFEAEQICSMATKDEHILGIKMDYAFTPDVDAILFGAEKVIKRDIIKKKLYEYDTKELLEKYELTQDDIIKVGLVLGCDYADKTPGIADRTVLKKFKDVELSKKQKIAQCMFKRDITPDEIKSIEFHNLEVEPFTDIEKYTELLDWLELKKCFNRSRIDKQFKKNGLFNA